MFIFCHNVTECFYFTFINKLLFRCCLSLFFTQGPCKCEEFLNISISYIDGTVKVTATSRQCGSEIKINEGVFYTPLIYRTAASLSNAI